MNVLLHTAYNEEINIGDLDSLAVMGTWPLVKAMGEY